MNKEEFWELIESSFREADWERDKQVEILTDKLSEYGEDDIFKFEAINLLYLEQSKHSKLWAAGYIMNRGCSDDCFDYFRAWIISRGEETYLNALKDPDSLSEIDIFPDFDNFENEAFLSTALNAFMEREDTKDINLFYEKNNFNLSPEEKEEIIESIEFDEEIDIGWDEDDDEELERLLPKLYELYW